MIVSNDAPAERGDVMAAAVTLHSPRFSADVAHQDWRTADLQGPSTVRMLIATRFEGRILPKNGRLPDEDLARVHSVLSRILA